MGIVFVFCCECMTTASTCLLGQVPYDCWASNPDIVAWMAAHNIAGNFSALESYYVQQVHSSFF